jgi:hypothetical protein
MDFVDKQYWSAMARNDKSDVVTKDVVRTIVETKLNGSALSAPF